MNKKLSLRRVKKNFFMLRLMAATVLTGVFLVCVLSVGNSLAQTWSEPTGTPPTNNVRAPIWNQNSTAQSGGLYVNGKGRFDTMATGDNNCTNSKVCGADAASVNGIVGESNTGYGVYASSVSNFGLVASSATSYAGYFSGNVYVTGGINVNGKNVCLSDGTNCLASGGYWTASGNNIFNSNTGNVGIGTPAPNYKLDVSGGIRTTGTLYANANGAAYLCGGDDACLNDVNIANTVGVYGAQDSTQGAIKLGSGGGTISGVGGAIRINGKDVCLADGSNCQKVALYGTQPTALLYGSECSITYNNGDGRLLGLPMEITAVRTGKIRVTVNGILRNSSSSADTTTVKLVRSPQAYGCTTGAQTVTPIASSKGIFTLNSSDRRAFETFAIYDVGVGGAYSFDLAVYNTSGTTIRFLALEYSIEEL